MTEYTIKILRAELREYNNTHNDTDTTLFLALKIVELTNKNIELEERVKELTDKVLDIEFVEKRRSINE